jgi:hypothetical protein
MGVNREGFLVIAPGDGPAFEYTGIRRAAEDEYWARYTLGTLFLQDDLPAALLYRNGFFSDPDGEPPAPPARALLPGNSRPAALIIPAFEELNAGGWEVDGLRRGPDGFWYYRVISRASARPVVRYFRGPGLNERGEEVSLGEYRNSAQPEEVQKAPPVLAETLEGAFLLADREGAAGSRPPDPPPLRIAALISPDFPGTRYFSSGRAGAGEGLLELSGFYRERFPGAPGEFFDLALVILPGGRGIYGRSSLQAPSGVQTGPFVLPPLPEGFVYTGLGLAGRVLVVPWEERQESGVGAAGFMVIDILPLSR